MDKDTHIYVSLSELEGGHILNQEVMKKLAQSSSTTSTMSQWYKVQQSPTIFRHMQQYYPPHFPMEVRYFLCQWIEDQRWDLIDVNNAQHAQLAASTLIRMLELLRQKAEELVNDDFFIIKVKLDESYKNIMSIVKTKPLEMIQTIKSCLAKEEELIKQLEDVPEENQMIHNQHETEQQAACDKIMSDIQNLFHATKSTEAELKNLQQKQESFILQFSDNQKITTQLIHLQNQRLTPEEREQKEIQLKKQKEQIDIQLATLAHELLCLRVELSKKHDQTITCLQELQKEILDSELIAWKRRQQLAGNGLILTNTKLETLQKWCEDLADLIWQNRQQIKKSTQLQQQLPIRLPEGGIDLQPKLNENITSLLSSLVTSTFIVEQQPPQVLKKDARFGAAVCLLVGGKLNVHMNPPQVKATIISEHQANELLKPKSDFKTKVCSCGEILNNSGTMEYQSNTGHLGITFRNMQLKKIKRADRKGSEAVTEEKFCILFQSDFNIGGNELVFQLWTLSLPVVVTVHGNQECNATATVLWDNAFAEPGRIPFAVPEQVEWNKLADQLNMKFYFSTGKELSKPSLDYLVSKLFRDKDPSTCMVSWTQFNKDTLSNRSFTFWEWFYGIQKLTKEYLKELWLDDAIIGFVSKDEAQNMLSGKPYGTFLLRFSDSAIGGVTIAWTSEKGVLNLAPFTSKDFSIRILADRIKDLNQLVTLYPDRPKDSVFSKYYTSTDDNPCIVNGGYIQPMLKTTIPEMTQNGSEIKQPLSQESVYDVYPNSVHSMEEVAFIPLGEVPEDFMEMDLNQLTDYSPSDIDEINDINVHQLLANHQFVS